MSASAAKRALADETRATAVGLFETVEGLQSSHVPTWRPIIS